MENQMDSSTQPKGSKTWLWVLIILVVVAVATFVIWKFVFNENESPADSSETSNRVTVSTEGSTPAKSSRIEPKWQNQGVAISGQFADADIIDLGGGKYRMYYAVEPEVAGNNLEVYSAASTDGIAWTKEEGTRKTMATFPDVMKLADGRFRMYFQNAGVIKSAISSDSLTWKDEAGTRIDMNETGYSLENVGAHSVIILDDGTYLMVYRGMIDEPYQTTEKIPNKNTQIFFYATSTDGLNFTKKGLALDSRNETLYGLADGAELVKWDNNQIRLYFWSYTGIYHIDYSNGQFSTTPTFNFTNKTNSINKFLPNPPSDPTLVKINNTWYMYYGQHTQGIYYATLTE